MSILLVLAAAFCGSLAGFVAARHWRAGRAVIAALVLLAATAAAAANATRFLLDLGWAFTTVDAMELTAFFVFAFSLTAAWKLLAPSRLRWLLALLVPMALFEPLRWALALIALSIRRLGL